MATVNTQLKKLYEAQSYRDGLSFQKLANDYQQMGGKNFTGSADQLKQLYDYQLSSPTHDPSTLQERQRLAGMGFTAGNYGDIGNYVGGDNPFTSGAYGNAQFDSQGRLVNSGGEILNTDAGGSVGLGQVIGNINDEQQRFLQPASAPTNAANINPNINSTKLPPNLPSVGSPSGAIASANGMGTMLDTLMKQNADNEKSRVEAEKLRSQESQTMLSKLLGQTTSPTDARNNAWGQTGITPANYFAEEKAKIAEIGTLTEEYNQTKAMMEQQIAASQDKLGSNNFINNQVQQIQRNAAPKLNMMSANINSKAAVLQALQGRFNEAQDYVNQAVQDATADTKYKMDIFTTFYQMNQDSINRLDSIYKDAFNTSMDLAMRQYEEQKAEKTQIGQLLLAYPKAGISMQDTLEQAYQKAASMPETTGEIVGNQSTGYKNVVRDSGGNIIKVEPISGSGSSGSSSGSTGSVSTGSTGGTGITTTLKQGSTGDQVKQLQSFLGVTADGQFGPKTLAAVKAFQSANGLTADGIVGPKTIAAMQSKGFSGSLAAPASGATNDAFFKTLQKTAGGKALTDTTIQSLTKGLGVLGQLGVLQSNIEGTNTGPLVGAFRGANPWNTNAQTIKAQLNAIVPNLARGIYGEVGVLTDNDIKTYSKTLPNLTSTEAIRNAVLYITLDMIGKSIKNTLSVNAAAGRDVSGFGDIYTNMEQTKNSILQNIGSAPATSSASTGFWSKVGNWLWGEE